LVSKKIIKSNLPVRYFDVLSSEGFHLFYFSSVSVNNQQEIYSFNLSNKQIIWNKYGNDEISLVKLSSNNGINVRDIQFLAEDNELKIYFVGIDKRGNSHKNVMISPTF
jgi:hypothetical protein